MPIPQRQTYPTSFPGISVQVTDDGSRTLFQRDSGEGYHSGCGALAETQHVYLRNSGVADRIENGIPTSVLEIGLGTGLGLLVTLDAAATRGKSIRYEAWESNWLPADVLRELNLGDCLNDKLIADDFIEFRAALPYPTAEGCYRWENLDRKETCFDVNIHVGDVRLCSFGDAQMFDAIYFDPFAPVSNPDLWEPGFLEKMRRVLSDDGRLVTYCCNRQVRDAMTSAGFKVRRVPGPAGGKREVLIATR
jgi:tRNA U34 5-methylaminomethyl-2-thiouridine-forming methyltransferase MnmC